MTNASQQIKTPFVLILPVCLLSFHRLRCRLTSSDPLQTLVLPFCPAIAFPGEVSSLHVSTLIGLQFGLYRILKPANKSVVDNWPLELRREKTLIPIIHPLCFPPFYRFRRCFSSANLLQTMAPSFFPAISPPGRFLALAYPLLSDCSSAYTEL